LKEEAQMLVKVAVKIVKMLLEMNLVVDFGMMQVN
jgi:hypothetical protein